MGPSPPQGVRRDEVRTNACYVLRTGEGIKNGQFDRVVNWSSVPRWPGWLSQVQTLSEPGTGELYRNPRGRPFREASPRRHLSPSRRQRRLPVGAVGRLQFAGLSPPSLWACSPVTVHSQPNCCNCSSGCRLSNRRRALP